MFRKLTENTRIIISKKFQHSWVEPVGYNTNINVYNCRVRKKVPLIVKNKDKISWYTCGPTVYDSAHLGHASCYVKFDIIQRILRNYFKLNLITVMNITDIDDKIIKRSKELSLSSTEVAKKYEREFWLDMQELNIIKPDIILRVTDNIPIISQFIEKILKENKAYLASDRSIYFDLNKSKNIYGKLTSIVYDDTAENKVKKSIGDFVLWKNSKENEPCWETNFGSGRPGWHSECAALASAVFGNNLDIHCGGIDLKFPHHENEEVLSCVHNENNQWVNYWLHSGHLNLLGQEIKMSKSLGNSIFIRDLLNKRKSAGNVFRMACAMSNYRANMEYSEEMMNTAESQLNKFLTFINNCDAYVSRILPPADLNFQLLNEKMIEVKKEIDAALKDDFNTAQVIKTISKLINTTNKMLQETISDSSTNNLSDCAIISAIGNFVREYCDMLGFDKKQNVIDENKTANILDILIAFRQNIRNIGLQNKDVKLLKYCDDLRDELKMYNIEVKDRGKLSSWNKT